MGPAELGALSSDQRGKRHGWLRERFGGVGDVVAVSDVVISSERGGFLHPSALRAVWFGGVDAVVSSER
ncbi:MAG: hypothetical protein KAI47_21470, partial [Deltaproteobacteria bacterium]|nr:hypothetical protein [Deltaproteobacteria bacterium]